MCQCRTLLADTENDEHQVTVKIFNSTLVNVLNIDLSMPDEKNENTIIDDLQNHDFTYTKKQILTQEYQLLIYLVQ